MSGPPLAITFDFGNTLVPVRAAGLRAVVAAFAQEFATGLGSDSTAFIAAWDEERERQIREELPRFREIDMTIRLRRVLARLRGLGPPPADVPWDDAEVGARSDEGEVAAGLEAYSRAFVAGLPPDPVAGPLLARLARRRRLAILSNWPLAATIDRYAEAAGWLPHLAAIVVSERVGAIKPQPAIFRAAEAALAPPGGPAPAPAEILHVGDDWGADVAGAKQAGWRAAHLLGRPLDTPLPSGGPPLRPVVPDIVLERLADLEPALERLAAGPADRRGGG